MLMEPVHNVPKFESLITGKGLTIPEEAPFAGTPRENSRELYPIPQNKGFKRVCSAGRVLKLEPWVQ